MSKTVTIGRGRRLVPKPAKAGSRATRKTTARSQPAERCGGEIRARQPMDGRADRAATEALGRRRDCRRHRRSSRRDVAVGGAGEGLPTAPRRCGDHGGEQKNRAAGATRIDRGACPPSPHPRRRSIATRIGWRNAIQNAARAHQRELPVAVREPGNKSILLLRRAGSGRGARHPLLRAPHAACLCSGRQP